MPPQSLLMVQKSETYSVVQPSSVPERPQNKPDRKETPFICMSSGYWFHFSPDPLFPKKKKKKRKKKKVLILFIKLTEANLDATLSKAEIKHD